MADHHAGRLEAFRRNAGKAAFDQQRAHPPTELPLLGAGEFQAVRFGVAHGIAHLPQGIGGQGGVIGMTTFFVGFHDLQPLLQVAGEAAAGGVGNARQRTLAEHHQAGAGGAAPAFLRCADQDIDAHRAHVDPECAGGDAVEDEKPIHLAHRSRHRPQVVVGQPDARSRLDMRRKHHLGTLGEDRGDHLVDRRRRKRGRFAVTHARAAATRLEHIGACRDPAHVENLRPAKTEPAIAQYQAAPATGKLARHGLHGKGAAARHHGHRAGAVGLPETLRDVAHHDLKSLRHVIECTVGIDHRIFQQSVGVHGVQQARHHLLQYENSLNKNPDPKKCRGKRHHRAASSAR